MSNLAFSDITFIPQKTDVQSRSDVDLSVSLGPCELNLPFVSSNMPDITEWKMSRAMADHSCLPIIHRFFSIEENLIQYKKSIEGANIKDWRSPYKVGVSVGIKEESKERFDALFEAGARLFTIDIAHGHSENMRNMIEYMRAKSGEVVIIAGNVATYWGAKELYQWGAQVVKVGVGGGSVCRTRTKTGFGVSQYEAIKLVRLGFENDGISSVWIISDGAIKFECDIPKALLWADAVMMGGAFAGTSETPGNVYEDHGSTLIDRRYYKLFGGSASSENKGKNRYKGITWNRK